MIFLVKFGINEHLKFFSKTTNLHSPYELVQFWSSLKTSTRAYLFQIALEIL